MSRIIYADHSATTAVRPEVLDVMLPYFTESYGNPSSIYGLSQRNRVALDHARQQVAQAIGASAREIYFTGGGTESDNWAIKGVAKFLKDKGNHIITSAVEHHAVLHTCRELEKEGFEVTYLPVDHTGMVSVEGLQKAITDQTILVSIMMANNEIGTLNPVAELGVVCKEKGILFHVDAVQAAGSLAIDVKEMNIDLLSLSAHKFYGPKGVGALYVRRGIKLPSFIHGGGQENRKRAGTENVPGIVGMGEALELAEKERQENAEHLQALRDRLIAGVLETIPHTRLNGHPTLRLPGHASFSFEFIEGESLLMLLDAAGICASSGSACTSGSLDPSHVLLAIGLPHEIAHGSLRLSLGRENTMEDVEYILEKLPPIVERLRTMSPLYEDYLREKQL